MKYAVLMYRDPAEELTPEQLETVAAKHEALRTELTRSGELIGGAGLADPQQTRSLRMRDGDVAATTGPLVETEEVLTAFYEVECADLERALAIAEHVLDFHVIATEVREVHDTADEAVARDQRN